MRHSRFLLILLVLLSALPGGALAQSPADAWSKPVNISQSGAADQPRIAAGSGGRVQVFWWDRFDGITTARFDGDEWGNPASASLDVETMPTVVDDGRGYAHAFWMGETDTDTGATPLLHSQMAVGGLSWSAPQTVAESAVAFDVAAAPEGGLSLAYVRVLHDSAFPAGVYVRRNPGGGAAWGAAAAVYKTIYFRLLTADNAHVRVADSDGVIHVVWDDPRLNKAFYARSANGGAAWSAPETLGDPVQQPARPRVFALPDGGALRMWEAAGMGGCVLYQQRLDSTWSAAQRVFEGMGTCPSAERSWVRDEGLLWLWGEGTGALALAAWDVKTARWSEPKSVSFSFQDADSGGWIGLGELRAALSGGSLVVAGSDPTSDDVWVTEGQASALDFTFAEASPWSEPARLSEAGLEASWPAVVVDSKGGMHVAWTASPVGDGPGTTLSYARSDAATGRWSRTIVLQQGISGTEMTRQPSLASDADGVLHLVWSSGEQGQIAYSRAKASEATSSGGWATPALLSGAESRSAWPQIGADAAGRLYVLYVVPLNEGRGVYLARSENGGDTWSEPTLVFDAAAAGWAMVDHPALLVADDGALHAAWVRGALPDTWPPQGIVYAHSDDAGSTWSKPQEVASDGYDWPRLAQADGKAHLLYAAATGGVWHRWISGAQAGNGSIWSVASRVRGWESSTGPFGLARSGPATGKGATLHLVAAGADRTAIQYSAWDGTAWSASETVPLGPDALTGLGVAAAARPEGGRLAVALLAAADGDGNAVPSVFGSARTIPVVDPKLLPTPAPTPTPVVVSSPTPRPTVQPSPTPNLNTPVSSGPPADPRILGAGLAAVIIAVALAVRAFRRGKRQLW